MDETQEIIRAQRFPTVTYAGHRRREKLCRRHHNMIAEISDYGRDNLTQRSAAVAYAMTLMDNCTQGIRCAHLPDISMIDEYDIGPNGTEIMLFESRELSDVAH